MLTKIGPIFQYTNQYTQILYLCSNKTFKSIEII